MIDSVLLLCNHWIGSMKLCNDDVDFIVRKQLSTKMNLNYFWLSSRRLRKFYVFNWMNWLPYLLLRKTSWNVVAVVTIHHEFVTNKCSHILNVKQQKTATEKNEKENKCEKGKTNWSSMIFYGQNIIRNTNRNIRVCVGERAFIVYKTKIAAKRRSVWNFQMAGWMFAFAVLLLFRMPLWILYDFLANSILALLIGYFRPINNIGWKEWVQNTFGTHLFYRFLFCSFFWFRRFFSCCCCCCCSILPIFCTILLWFENEENFLSESFVSIFFPSVSLPNFSIRCTLDHNQPPSLATKIIFSICQNCWIAT